MLSGDRLAVWGDPIAHSLSPRLHAAAYRELGRDWVYERRRVDEAAFSDALSALDASWRGLSLTMPLKGVAARRADRLDERARLTGAANTLLLGDGDVAGFNTDVGGLVRTLREQGVEEVGGARILGAGATATSALVALAELGARHVEVLARRPERAADLARLAEPLGILVTANPFEAAEGSVDVTLATLPGGADLGPVAPRLAEGGGLLVDVVYGQWPTPLAQAWRAASGEAVPGLGMLLHQALLQVRIFDAGSPDVPLPDEPAVLAAMRAALEA